MFDYTGTTFNCCASHSCNYFVRVTKLFSFKINILSKLCFNRTLFVTTDFCAILDHLEHVFHFNKVHEFIKEPFVNHCYTVNIVNAHDSAFQCLEDCKDSLVSTFTYARNNLFVAFFFKYL